MGGLCTLLWAVPGTRSAPGVCLLLHHLLVSVLAAGRAHASGFSLISRPSPVPTLPYGPSLREPSRSHRPCPPVVPPARCPGWALLVIWSHPLTPCTSSFSPAGPSPTQDGAGQDCVVAAEGPHSLTTRPCAGAAPLGPLRVSRKAGVRILGRMPRVGLALPAVCVGGWSRFPGLGRGERWSVIWSPSPLPPSASEGRAPKGRVRYGSCSPFLRVWKAGWRREAVKAQKGRGPVQGPAGNRVSQVLAWQLRQARWDAGAGLGPVTGDLLGTRLTPTHAPGRLAPRVAPLAPETSRVLWAQCHFDSRAPWSPENLQMWL